MTADQDAALYVEKFSADSIKGLMKWYTIFLLHYGGLEFRGLVEFIPITTLQIQNC